MATLITIRDHSSLGGTLSMWEDREGDFTIATNKVEPGFTWVPTKFPLTFYLAGMHAIGTIRNIQLGEFEVGEAAIGYIDMSDDHFIQLNLRPTESDQITVMKFAVEDFRRLMKVLTDYWCE